MGDSDVGDLSWWRFVYVGDRISMLVTYLNIGFRRQCENIVDVGVQITKTVIL